MAEAQTEQRGLGQGEEDGSRFRRHSIFEDATAESISLAEQSQHEPSGWVDEAREAVEERAQYFAFVDDDGRHMVKIPYGWMRIGRSRAADLRLDDATVSRRHALVVNDEERGLRVLDDRSLNGVCINGQPIEWGTLNDGDELQVGRFRLFVIDAELFEAAS